MSHDVFNLAQSVSLAIVESIDESSLCKNVVELFEHGEEKELRTAKIAATIAIRDLLARIACDIALFLVDISSAGACDILERNALSSSTGSSEYKSQEAKQKKG